MSNTYGIKYLGSKKKLLPFIQQIVETLPEHEKSVLDVFSGTTRVGQAFRQLGYQVTTSDLSNATECFAALFIEHPKPSSLEPLVAKLNALSPRADWITKTYCDVVSESGRPIRVWKPKNGMKADAIREEIARMAGDGEVSSLDEKALIALLILALDKVDNTVGVQQSYLAEWKAARADNDLKLTLEALPENHPGKHIRGNAQSLSYPPASIAYLDPPYTSHNYGSYYHIWDSIALWDKPEVGLSTNRRKDRIFSKDDHDESFVSPWYTAKGAKKALTELLTKLPVRFVLLSYNNEGLLSEDVLKEVLESHPKVSSFTFHEIDYKRNIMSKIGRGAVTNWDKQKNKEYVISVDLTADS